MKTLSTALLALLCSVALSLPAMAQAEGEYFEVAGVFGLTLPPGGELVVDEEQTDAESLVYSWQPGAEGGLLELVQIRADYLGEPVESAHRDAFVSGMLSEWEADPESYEILVHQPDLQLSDLTWTMIEVQHNNVEPTVWHLSLSAAYDEQIYTLIFYYLNPSEAAGELMVDIADTFVAAPDAEDAADLDDADLDDELDG